jgi:inner membrane protein
MDPIAHSLFGAALSRTALGHDRARQVLPGATVALVVGANLPDVDALFYFLGGDLALLLRRGVSHGPLGLVALPALFVACWRLVERWRARREKPWNRLLVLVYLATLSHPALDWLNTYGVRFLAPFDWRWFYGDALFIVDPWMWLLLAAATLLGRGTSARTRRAFRVLGLLGSILLAVAASLGVLPIGAVLVFVVAVLALAWVSSRQVSRKGGSVEKGASARDHRPPAGGRETTIATVLVVVFVCYVLAMVFGARASRSLVQATLEEQGRGVDRLVVSPMPATPLAREWVALTADGYRVGSLHWLKQPRVRVEEGSFPRLPEHDPVVERALEDPCIRGFVNWMRMPSVEVGEADSSDKVHVRLFDLRYSRAPSQGFGGARSLVDAADLESE